MTDGHGQSVGHTGQGAGCAHEPGTEHLFERIVTAPHRPVFVTPGRHPFEVGPLLACVLVGSVMAFTQARPPSMSRGLPEPLLTVWLIMIACGGLVGLIGCYWRGAINDGLLVELVGVCAIGAACTIYVIALLAGNPWPASVGSAGLLAGLAAGGWGRTVQCAAAYRRVRRGVVRPVHVELPLLVEEEHDSEETA